MQGSRLREHLYTAAVLTLLLLISLTNGYVAVTIALLLLLSGLVLFPDMRRTAILSAFVAAGVAITVVVLRTLF